MDELMLKEFKTFMKEKLEIEINECNEDVFLSAFKQRKDYNSKNCSFEVFKLKGDALLGLLACEKYIDNYSTESNPTAVKEKYVGNKKLQSIFDKLKLEKYFSYERSNEIGKHNKSDCIEALLYATYCAFDMEKASKVLDLLFENDS